MKGHRGGEYTGEAAKYGVSVVHRWLERPATHRAPRTGDGSMQGNHPWLYLVRSWGESDV